MLQAILVYGERLKRSLRFLDVASAAASAPLVPERARYAITLVCCARVPIPQWLPMTTTGTAGVTHQRFRTIGVGFVFLWFLLGGIAHFAATSFEMRMVPPYIPWPRVTVWASGVFELIGATGLLFGTTRRAAGWGLLALTIAVTPANIYMMQHAALFHVPYWVLVLRLALQVALLALIAWSAAVPPPPRRAA